MKCLALLLALLLVPVTSARAQARPEPRLEIVGGVLLLPTALATGVLVGLLMGPGFASCSGWGPPETPEEEACEAKERRDQEQGWRVGAGVGAIVAAGGIALIWHGARRVRRQNATSYTSGLRVLPQLGRDGYGLVALRRF